MFLEGGQPVESPRNGGNSMTPTSRDGPEDGRLPEMATFGNKGVKKFWRRHRAVFEIVRWFFNILILVYKVFHH
jgi:hypothetical protein